MGAIAQALTDKDFLNASPDDQKAYLAHVDKDFSAASPKDQQAYLNHILAPARLAKAAQPTQFEQNINSRRGVTDAYDPNASGVTQRFLGAAGGALLSAPGAIINAIAHPVDTASNAVKGVSDSVAAYENPKTRPTWEGIKSVLPEALGMGFGNAAAAYTPEAVQGVREMASPYKPQVMAAADALRHPTEIPGKVVKAAVNKAIPDPYSPPERPFLGPDTPTRSQFALSQKIAGEQAPPAPEPELGSPENPGFMSKLPSRLPQGLRGDPFSPRPVSVSEALRQAAPDDVAVVPDERPAVAGDRPGSAWSLTRTEGLPEAAQRGQPGAINVLRQLKPTVVTPRSGGFDSPNMQALRESLGITESVPQGNPTPYSPPAPAPKATDSAFAPWFKPRRTPVLQ